MHQKHNIQSAYNDLNVLYNRQFLIESALSAIRAEPVRKQSSELRKAIHRKSGYRYNAL